jgi:hypothetical protein
MSDDDIDLIGNLFASRFWQKLYKSFSFILIIPDLDPNIIVFIDYD